MFTGLIEEMGTVARLIRRGGGARLEVRSSGLAQQLKVGDSVAVNGACVTVTETNGQAFACDLVPETVARTNLGIVQIGEQVNLEMPMRAVDRFGGHIVQGHVDCVGLVRSRRRAGAQEMLEVTVPFELTRYLAPQGSVAIDGVSLTVVGVDRDRFRVALIPHTVSVTTLGQKGQGASVNVEVDVLSKYVERHLIARQTRPLLAGPEDTAPEAAEQRRPGPEARPAPEQKRPQPVAAAAKPATRPAKPAPPPAKPARAVAAKASRTTSHRSGGKKKPVRAAAPRRTAAKPARRGATRAARPKPARRRR